MIQTWMLKLVGFIVAVGGVILAVLGMKSKAKSEGKSEVVAEVKVKALEDTIDNMNKAAKNDEAIDKADDAKLDVDLDEWMRD